MYHLHKRDVCAGFCVHQRACLLFFYFLQMQLCSLCQFQAAVTQGRQRGGGWLCARDLEEKASPAKLVAIPTGPIKVIDYLTPL